ncbi:MAG: substrate-binding domain-containing protein [Beutenbergiaceae bacterium]
MRRMRLAGVAAVLGVLALAACSTGSGPDDTSSSSEQSGGDGDGVTIAIIPKINGIPYYQAVETGVNEAAEELGEAVEVIWNGPAEAEASAQIQIIQNMINAEVDVIAIASNDPAAVAPALQQAQDAGIHVMSWDGDADVREIFVQLIDANDFGAALADQMAEEAGPDAEVAVVTSTLTAPNQSAWLAGIEARIAQEYPDMSIVTTTESGEDQQLAMQQSMDIIRAYPDVAGIFAITTAALPGAAQAVEQLDLSGDIAVVGNSTPNAIKQYFDSGTLQSAVLWNPIDHGYLTVFTAYQLASEGVSEGTAFEAGRLGEYTPEGDDISTQITLSPPLVFTPENINDYDF